MRISIYPIYGLAREFDYDPFDKGALPFQILPNVTIEDVTPLINEETWGWVRNAMGRDDFDHLINIRYAIVTCNISGSQTPRSRQTTNRKN